MSLKTFSSLKDLSPKKSYFVTFGNFDGIHKGHQKVLKILIKESQRFKATPIIISFSKHTKLEENDNNFLIERKIKHLLLKNIGVEAIVYLDFEEVKKLRYKDFIAQLVNYHQMKGLVASDKLKIGYQKRGTADKVKQYLKDYCPDCFVKILPSFEISKGIVSSTLIRDIIQKGDIHKANRLLQLPFHIESKVIAGKKNGRKIKYPTINIEYPNNIINIKKGVYVTLCLVEIGGKNILFPAMTFFGCSFSNDIALVESYLFDFNQDIYNKKVIVFFLKYLRDKKKMDGLIALQNQLDKDKSQTETFIKTKGYQKLFEEINCCLDKLVLT